MRLSLVSCGAFYALLALVACSSSDVQPATSVPETDGGVDAAPTPPPACEADTDTDSANCGACGNVCEGGKFCRAGACVLESAFAIRKLFLGEADRQGNKSPDAWRAYGRNIDGIVSTSTPNGECTRVAGAPASSAEDGEDGIDNAWGKSVLKVLEPLFPDPSLAVSGVLEGGEQTIAIVGTGWAAPADTATLAGGVFLAEPSVSTPKWDGTDARKMSFATVENGAPKVKFLSASVSGGVFDSGDLAGPVELRIGALGAFIVIPIHKARITMTISPDGKTATNGTLSGVASREALAEAVGKLFGFVDRSLCEGSIVEGIEMSVRQAADIMADGTQNPDAECDGISIGIGFEATRFVPNAVGLPGEVPSIDPCQ